MFTFSLLGIGVVKCYLKIYLSILGCGWDGGDCCGDNVNTQYCSVCACLDPNPQKVDSTCVDIWSGDKCANKKNKGKCDKFWMKKNCQKTCEFC